MLNKKKMFVLFLCCMLTALVVNTNKCEAKKKYVVKSCPSNTNKSYMDYKCITDKSSKQYKLQNKAKTDKKTGIRIVKGRYCIAVGSYYSKKIGTKLDLVMKNGKVIKCILADVKSDSDTINKHRQHRDGSIVEFIVDTKKIPRIVRLMGDISYTKPFKSRIKQIRVYKKIKKKGVE